jgi:hypothetical protein
MGQAADSFWLDILIGFWVSAGFLSVDRPVVLRSDGVGVWCSSRDSSESKKKKKKRNFKLWSAAPEKGVPTN